jgi:hypothetical protein
MINPWAAITLFMDDSSGPYVFVRAEGLIQKFRRRPMQVAFSSYRMNAGGLFSVFVHVQSPEVEAYTGNPAVFENPHNLNQDVSLQLVEALISRDNLEVCFTASGKNGPCTGYFGVAVPLPEPCRRVLKDEWDQLLEYHRGIPVGRRSFKDCVAQMERETPIHENPILNQ